MKSDLQNLLNNFQSGKNIPPLLLSNDDIIEAINFLKETSLTTLDDLKSEYIQDLRVFNTDDRIFKKELAEKIIEQVSIKSSGDFNVFVILEIDKFNKESGNMLLKTFEDIPDRTIFLFTSNSEEDVLDTIKSRIIKISSDKRDFFLDENIKSKIDAFFDGKKLELLSYLYKEKLERDEYLNILVYLKEKIKEGKITKIESIDEIIRGISNIYNSNANPRNIVDKVFLSQS
ncbi:MAG: hypothetical protein PHO80_03415 [Candidatus Gracilibacteria bacterium]|nr:hypothetical protein [Candidatus Gracilibacteria bacterium]MDD4530570.1 hypothetical protein [Candidatus Gracilibacteria bacterium]